MFFHADISGNVPNGVLAWRHIGYRLVVMGRLGKRLVVAALFCATGFSLFGTGAALGADNTLSSSNPAPSEVVSVAPTQLQLVFTEVFANPEDVSSMGISLVCNGNIVNLGAAQLGADVKTVSVPLTQVPSAGTCTVSWALPDGSSGAFNFTSAISVPTTSTTLVGGVTTPSTVVPGTGEAVTTDSSPRVGGPLGLFRMLSYMFAATLFGAFILILFGWPEGVEYPVCKKFIRLVWILALLSTIAVLIYTTAQATGKGVTASISPNAWRELLDTLPGQGLIVRFLLVCGVGWLALDPQKILDPATQFFSVTLIVLLCATFGFDRTGGRLPALGYVNAMVHMLSISAWFGGLVLLVRVVLIGPGESDLMDAVRGFGRIASRAIVLVVLTGVFSTYRFDGFSIFTSQHGRLVLVKILLVGFMAYATFVTRTFVLTRLNRATTLTNRAAARLRRAVGVEAGVGVVVLGVTALMMATTPIHFIEKAPAGGPVYAFSQDLKNDRFHVRFSVSPATVGPNQVLIELFEPRRIQDFTVRMTPKADGYDGYLITVPLTRRGAALVGANGDFPMKAPGDWTIEINGTSTTGDLEPLSTTLTLVDPATSPTSAVPTSAVPTSSTVLAPG